MSSYKQIKTPGDTKWFQEDRFGMFIHFGLYALPARHEWVKFYERPSEEKYQKYFDHFNPDLFDAKEWAKSAKAAGMKYAVLTTKHHEGFCLFDSQFTDYKSTNTPFKRDIVREYVDAFRAEGLKVGFYYSLLDWHHPDFPLDRLHPRRFDENAEQLDKGRDVRKYAQYMRDQITELLSNYGKIDILWFDFTYPNPESEEDKKRNIMPWMQHGGCKSKDEWESEKLIALCRKLQPDIIINDRTHIEQDLRCPEQCQPTEWEKDEKTGDYTIWEACQTFSGSWGYNRDETSWKNEKMLIDMLVNTVSVGGNLIMNVGPTSRGYFDRRAKNALSAYGEWMKYNSRSIYGCTMAEPEFTAPAGTKITQSMDEKRLYIHLQTYPLYVLKMDALAGKIDYVQLLGDGSEIRFEEDNESESKTVTFRLPVIAPAGISPVIEIFLK